MIRPATRQQAMKLSAAGWRRHPKRDILWISADERFLPVHQALQEIAGATIPPSYMRKVGPSSKNALAPGKRGKGMGSATEPRPISPVSPTARPSPRQSQDK
jgi:hypothetical protein